MTKFNLRSDSFQVTNFALEMDGEGSFVDVGKWSKILDGKSSFMVDLWVLIDGTR